MPSTNELLQEGRYRIGQRTTGSEDIFEAYDTVRNTNVVVREIPVKLNKVATVAQRESINVAFTNQAKALAEIEHRSLPNVHDYFAEIDRQFIVMDAVEGENLAALLARGGKPFDVSQVNDWADQILDALHYLHTHKPSIVHRNIRPQNVYVDQAGKVTLLGVGVETESPNADETSSLRYSPIEQIWPGLDPASQKAITNSYDDRSERILKEPLDARSDIYSLGATLYYLVTGSEPVDPLERSIDLLEGKLDPLRQPVKVNSSIPAEISDVLMKALEIKRENRYDSAFIMRQVLKDAIGRVQERLDEEAREEEEAAEIIRRAAQAKNDTARNLIEETHEAEGRRLSAAREEEERRLLEAEENARQRREAEEQRRADEEEQRIAREAEEQRLRDEEERQRQRLEAEEQSRRAAEEERRRAEDEELRLKEAEDELLRKEAERKQAEVQAEAERLRREEKEATAIAEASIGSVLDDEVLEIPAEADVTAFHDRLQDVDEDELTAVLQELEAAEAASVEEAQATELIEVEDESEGGNTDVDSVQEFEQEPENVTPTAEPAVEIDDEIFSLPEKHGSSIPMLAVAGAIGLVVVIAVGIWYAMSGQSQPQTSSTPAQTQPVQVALPAPENTPAVDQVISSQSQPEAANTSTEAPVEQPVAVARNTPAPAKPKKAEAAKPEAEKKKAVTVDDLINDN